MNKHIDIVLAIKEYILKNNLPIRSKMPSGRTLSKILNCNYHLVHDAYETLQNEGIVEIRERSGTYLSDNAYDLLNQQSPNWNKLIAMGWYSGSDMSYSEGISKVVKGAIFNTMGYLDSSFEFGKFISESMHEVASDTKLNDSLHILNLFGLPKLRKTLVEYLGKMNINTNKGEILLYPSFYTAVEVMTKSLMRAGFRAYVSESEDYEYYQLFMKSLGVDIVKVPNDKYGLDINYIKKNHKVNKPTILISNTLCVYKDINATTVERKREILNWCNEVRMPIVELDLYGGILQENVTLKSMDKHNNVIYFGSLPIAVAYGVNVAWSVTPASIIKRLQDVRHQTHIYPMNMLYLIVDNFISSGRYEQFIKQYHPKMEKRVELTNKLLKRHLPINSSWQHNIDTGLFAIDVADDFFNKFNELDINMVLFPKYSDSSRPNNKIMILSGCLSEDKLEESIKMIGDVIKQFS